MSALSIVLNRLTYGLRVVLRRKTANHHQALLSVCVHCDHSRHDSPPTYLV